LAEAVVFAVGFGVALALGFGEAWTSPLGWGVGREAVLSLAIPNGLDAGLFAPAGVEAAGPPQAHKLRHPHMASTKAARRRFLVDMWGMAYRAS
jgi:hypothetical protein